MKKILIIWPLGSPIYISNFWRSSLLYEVAAHIRKHGCIVDVFDGLEHQTFSELFRVLLSEQYESIILHAPLDMMDGFIKTFKYIRLLDPVKPIFIYGLSTLLSPKTFRKMNIQGYSNSGFYEKGILSFLGLDGEYSHCVLKQDGEWREYSSKRKSPNFWSFMDINDTNKFPVICMTISRGCQGGCNFCRHALLHGNNDLRKPIDEVCEYIGQLERFGFSGMIEFASPTFTIDKNWVENFCAEYLKHGFKTKWRCVTRVDRIDPNIIKNMASANCVRIGLGVETMSVKEQKALNKRILKDRVLEAIQIIQNNGIEVLTYLISGIEKQQGKNFIDTYNELKRIGANPVVYALLRYENLNFEDFIETSIAADMCTSSLNAMTDINNYDLLRLIL